MLIGIWLLAVGVPFAIWPTGLSRIADRLRLQTNERVSPRQAHYARFAGIALAAIGTSIVVATQIKHHA